MEISNLNPHIRYARAHNNILWEHSWSYNYDCRLFFIKQGTGILIANDLKCKFSNNTVIYLPGGCRYRIILDKPRSPFSVLIFNFDLVNDFFHLKDSLGTATEETFIPDKVLSYDVPFEFSEIIVQNVPHIYESLKKCTDNFLVQTLYYREMSSAIFKSCLLELLRSHTATPVSQVASEIMDYIHKNFHNTQLSNQDIASAFNYHPYYASQLMKQSTGQTMHNYLLSYRIRMAKNYLITTDLDINTIAWKCGFNSVSYFIKLFRTSTGVTPRNYRHTHTNWIF